MEDLKKLLQELDHYDPHRRQNGVIGLGQLLLDDKTRNSLLSEDKASIVTNLLTRLEPKENSIEVKGRTVRVFSQIGKFLKDTEIVQIFTKIISYITNPNAEGKDIYVTCIKAILKEIPSDCCYTIGKVIIPVLEKGINSQSNEILELCFDTFNDYISSFNTVLIKESESVIANKKAIIDSSITHISSNSETLQNRVINFIGTFSLVLKQKDLEEVVTKILNKFNSSNELNVKIACFNTLNSIAKVSASKQAESAKAIITLISKYANIKFLETDDRDYDQKNDLVESALNLLDTLLTKLNTTIKSDSKAIIADAVCLIEYDPNYSYDNQEEEVGNYDEYEGYEQVATLDDSSWKVRRAAVTVLETVAKTGIQIDKEQKEKIITILVKSLREHDENTKNSIITCLSSYLSTLVVLDDTSQELQLKRMSSLVQDFIPSITSELLDAIIKHLNGTNANVKTKVLHLLPVLASIGSNELIGAFDNLKPCFDATCFSENSNTLIFFSFLKQLFQANKQEDNYTEIYLHLIQYIEKGLSNEFYKVNIEAVSTAGYLIPILAKSIKENDKYIQKIYNDIIPKLQVKDIDKELRLVLISTISLLIIHCGQCFTEKVLNTILTLFLDKMKNENIRPYLFTWLIKIIENGKELPLNKAIQQYLPLILELVERSQINIQYQVLSLLEKIYINFPKAFSGSEEKIITTILSIKTEDDSLVPLVYSVFTNMTPFLNANQLRTILEKASVKLETISAVGSQIHSLFDFAKVACEKANKSDIQKIVSKYSNIAAINTNVSKFVGILASSCGEDKKYIDLCMKNLNSNQDDNIKKNSLTLLGDICVYSKQTNSHLLDKLEKMVTSNNDELNLAISISIGKIGLSDYKTFIQITTSQKANRFNFISIREFLSLIIEKNMPINEDELNNIYSWLNQPANFNDDQLNKLCGECLGLITSYNQKFITSYIQGFSSTTQTKSAYYYGAKFIFNNRRNTIGDTDVSILVQKLIEGLKETDLIVKENCFNSLMSAAHHYSNEVKEHYNVLMEIFNLDHKINSALIEEADFGGGMKIKNDKGINIRKAVYATVKIFVDCFPQKINVTDTVQICLDGFLDTEDIQLIVFGCLMKLAHLFPSAFCSFIESLCDRLKTSLDKIKAEENKKVFAVNVQRLFKELKAEHEIEENPKFMNLFNETMKICAS